VSQHIGSLGGKKDAPIFKDDHRPSFSSPLDLKNRLPFGKGKGK
jgi:hypothetical protein